MARVFGTQMLIKQLNRIPLDARAGIGRALAVSVMEMDAYAKQKIQGGSRGGRVYRRGAVTHQASAPGEFPKTDRGSFVASFFFRVGGDKLSAFWGTKDVRGRWFHFGTSRMKKRPWAKPTLDANKQKISDRLGAAVLDAIKKAKR